MKKILVVAAHPDDETLGCGATIAKHVQQGNSVAVLILGEGITSRKDIRDDADPGEVEMLREHSKRALARLGVNDVTYYGLIDNRFDSMPLLDIVKIVEKVIAEKTPEVVYTHHWGDLNIDHRATFQAVLTACRPGLGPVRKLLSFEVMSSTEWNVQKGSEAFMPTVFEDVESTLSQKLDALAEYKNEMRAYPHPRSVEGLRILAQFRGTIISKKAAEAFELVREVI